MLRFIDYEIVLYILLIALGLGSFFLAVIWPTTAGFYTAIVAAAVCGIAVTVYIWYSKRYSDHLACPTGGECNAVVTSKYSKFFGIHLEYLGFLYYTTIFASYIALLTNPALQETVFLPMVMLMTAGSFLFSLYLLFIQGAVLRIWCIWCLLSAALSSYIFVLSLVSLEEVQLAIANIAPALEAAKQLGFILGMGGATTGVLLFMRFLEDKDISKKEYESLDDLTELIWIGFGLVLLSEYARFLAFSPELGQSGLFVTEIIVLSIAFLSAATLKLLFTPMLEVLPFDPESAESGSPLFTIRKATLVIGSITMTSWYYAFLLNHIPLLPLHTALIIYAISVATVIGINLTWQRTFE